MSSPTPAPTDAGAAFFDGDYHRILAPFHPESEARTEVAAVRELLGLSQSERILDLGCGWGRHLSLLHEAGHPVVGFDLSHALLRRVAAPGEGVDPPPRVAGDMLRLPFGESTFDVVLNLATSLGLFLEDVPAEAALGEARRVLRPDGRLLIEGMHRDDVVANYAERDAWTLDDGTDVRVRRRFDAVRGVSHEVLRWSGPEGSGRKRHSLRLRNATEMEALIEAAGFRVDAVHGAWNGAPFQRESERLIIVAR